MHGHLYNAKNLQYGKMKTLRPYIIIIETSNWHSSVLAFRMLCVVSNILPISHQQNTWFILLINQLSLWLPFSTSYMCATIPSVAFNISHFYQRKWGKNLSTIKPRPYIVSLVSLAYLASSSLAVAWIFILGVEHFGPMGCHYFHELFKVTVSYDV
jgi:hypothetical protein